MPFTITGLQCCGIKEIGGLRTVGNSAGTFDGFERELRTFISTYSNGNVTNAYFIFSAVEAGGVPRYGEAFTAFILKNNLGMVQETTVNKNPNSGNMLRVYLWTIDQPKLKDWYAKGAPTGAPIPAPRRRTPRATSLSTPPPTFDHET